MKLSDLIQSVPGGKLLRDSSREIASICYDSRDVSPGCLFVAMKGGSHDGHSYIPRAIEAGAVAIVGEELFADPGEGGVGYALVEKGRPSLGHLAAALYGNPSRKLKLIGVTGTSGKTTVTHLIQAVFNHSGAKAGLIGTLGTRVGDTLIPTKHTTPEPSDIQQVLAQMVDEGVQVVAMEASSHGLFQGRVTGCEFDCGVFTNIARDHLDFHKTLEAYLDAKLMLFRDYPSASGKKFVAVVNADDAAAEAVISAASGNAVTFGVDCPTADFRACDIEVTESSVKFTLNHSCGSVPVEMAIGGYFNVYNALAATAAAVSLGMSVEDAVAGLAKAKSVAGRFESIKSAQDFGVIVDYAHTPDELENVLRTARSITKNRLIAVFGCGGDRDKGKRPIMGGIAAAIADVVLITSDNPRTEKPGRIIEDILAGVPKDYQGKLLITMDRREAIKLAIQTAKAGDVVVIAGKGHEDYQIFADRTIHFDDREVAREILAQESP